MIALFLALAAGATAPVWSAFSSQGIVTLSASVTIGSSGVVSGSTLTIQAVPLPSQALFGKNMAIPVVITSSKGPVNTSNLTVDIVYQLLDTSGSPINAPIAVPVQFVPGAASGNSLSGLALVERSDLLPIQNGGGVAYVFQARQGTAGTLLNTGGLAPAPANITSLQTLPSPFVTTIRDPWCEPVGPAGAVVSAADLSENDGHTAVALQPNAVPAPGTLCIHVQSAAGLPLGPGRTDAAAIYTITLQDTALNAPVQLVLSYPSDLSGKVLDLNADPSALGIYWLAENVPGGTWQPLSQAALDTTLHTLTGQTGHFSTFALFAAGPIGASDLRPAQRIITPNGDGINDTAVFSGLGTEDQVKIFDVRGRRVRTIAGPNAVWDGKDDSGSIVASGVYIYQYTTGGTRVSGVIMVAK